MAYISFQPKDYFNTVLYTGTGAENAVTGVGFQPDFTWLKNRATTNHHTLFDAVRGANKVIYSNLNAQQYTVTQELKSFDSDGFTVGTEASANGSGNGIVSWNWKANGAGSSNTDGSITSTVSASTTSGFSIVQFTGTGANATVGHGLGSAPKMVIVKETSGSDAWIVGHSSIGFTKNLLLNGINAEYADSTIWNNTAPTSSVFSVGSSNSSNESGATYIAYCFAEKKGFSKFGSYTGNASTDGPFVYCGFKPAFVMMKGYQSGGSDNWNLCDNKRVGYNAANWRLYPNATAGENSTSLVDILSNGFKLTVSSTDLNASAKGYIYMAFAEAPLVSSNGVPSVAR